MSDNSSDDLPDLTDDIFGVGAYEAAKPPKKDFHAWHRPRKQYVREQQWGRAIGQVLDAAEESDQVLSYLGLPGPDLLDLRFIHTVLCAPRGIGLRFLGFNRAAVPGNAELPELEVSLDEVRRLPRVDPRSVIVGDDLSHIGNENSLAWKRTYELGPFDVVNWDLCEGFAAAAPSDLDNDQYRAMNRLMSLQARSKRPWLLFLTTLVDPGTVDPTVLQLLAGKYVSNLVSCHEFAVKSGEEFQLANEAQVESALRSHDGLVRVFVTGLCKWLTGIAAHHAPPTETHVESVVAYKVNGAAACEDLVSIAIRFTPTTRLTSDATGLVRAAEDGPNECRTAGRALMAVSRRKNVDAVLAGDEAQLAHLIDASAELLNTARYDVPAYRKWVERESGR